MQATLQHGLHVFVFGCIFSILDTLRLALLCFWRGCIAKFAILHEGGRHKKISQSPSVTGRRWREKHAAALGACETCHVGQSLPKLERLVIKPKVPLHNLRTAYCCIVCCNNGDMPVGRGQILWSIYFYQEEAASAPPSAAHSTLQPAACKHLFHPPCRRLGASSFTRGRTHTGPVILSLVTRTTRYVVNPHKHTGFFFVQT